MTSIYKLREAVIRGENKCARMPIPSFSVKDLPLSLPERKAMALKEILERCPVYIGEGEKIVGTRTFFAPRAGNEDGHDHFLYGLYTKIPYVTEGEIEAFGGDYSYRNKTHATPDFGIVLKQGIGGILASVEERKEDPSLHTVNRDFLSSVTIAYTALQNFVLRYAKKAEELAEEAKGEEKEELKEIACVCRKISVSPPDTFREAIQLLWMVHLGTIMESFEFVNYGRLDVLLTPFLKDTPREEALYLLECFLLKMYDQADVTCSYLGKYAAQLVVTLGGVLPNGENAVSDVTMLFLEAVDAIRLPEPELNLRISSQNPPEFLQRAAELTVSGCNFISYYNDDVFLRNLTEAGLSPEDAASYGFDLCQDINIPGKGDFWLAGSADLAQLLLELLGSRRDYATFDSLLAAYKERIAEEVEKDVVNFCRAEAHMDLYAKGETEAFFQGIRRGEETAYRRSATPMAPLPLISPLYHGSIEQALDITLEPYPIKDKGYIFGTAVEAVNSLAALKKTVFEDHAFSLEEVWQACEEDFQSHQGKIIQAVLWNCPKWGNDEAFVDDIAKDLLDFCLTQCQSHRTFYGGRVLGGIHQPHPVPSGEELGATPEGRHNGAPVAVTLTPENGTMERGATAVLNSAAKIDSSKVYWNFCVMVNYFSSVFEGNQGSKLFETLLKGYFEKGGLQHQPNVVNVEDLRRAQENPEQYRDLIVRLWGVSAYFVNLPRAIQEEMIARFT